MFSFLKNFAAWQLLAQADVLTICVLLALFTTSVVCVAVIAFKFSYFRSQREKLVLMGEQLQSCATLDECAALVKKSGDGLAAQFLRQAIQNVRSLLRRVGCDDSAREVRLSEDDFARFDTMVSQVLDAHLLEAERFLPILGVSAAVAPLVGLFGTVWGLIHAFVNIGYEKSADITVIAPGIAEALTTTLAGLIVAIPAMIFFHYFSNELRKIEGKLGVIADHVSDVVYHAFVNGS